MIKEETQAIEISPLSSKSYANWALTPFLNREGTDSAKIFAVTDLVVGGENVSSNLTYFVAPKLVHLLPVRSNRLLPKWAMDMCYAFQPRCSREVSMLLLGMSKLNCRTTLSTLFRRGERD